VQSPNKQKVYKFQTKILFSMVFKYYKKVPRVVIIPVKNSAGDFVSLPDRTMKIRVRVVKR